MSVHQNHKVQHVAVTAGDFGVKLLAHGMTPDMRQYFFDNPGPMSDLMSAAGDIYDKRRDKNAEAEWLPFRRWVPLTDDENIEVYYDGTSDANSHELTVRQNRNGVQHTYVRRVQKHWMELLDGILIKKPDWPGSNGKGHALFLIHREPQEPAGAL